MEICAAVLDDDTARKLLFVAGFKGWSVETAVEWVLREALAAFDPGPFSDFQLTKGTG